MAIRLLYMLGEALPAAHGAHFSGHAAKTSVLQDMMRTVRPAPLRTPGPGALTGRCPLSPQLVSCEVSGYQHASVSLEFFETVVRYDKFFLVEPQHVPTVLVSGRDPRPVPLGTHFLSVTACFLSDGLPGPARAEEQQPEGPQPGGLPVLPLHQEPAVSLVPPPPPPPSRGRCCPRL